jgi:hypothetical protein
VNRLTDEEAVIISVKILYLFKEKPRLSPHKGEFAKKVWAQVVNDG